MAATDAGGGEVSEVEQSAQGPEAAAEFERSGAEGPAGAGAGDMAAEGEVAKESHEPEGPTQSVSAAGVHFGNSKGSGSAAQDSGPKEAAPSAGTGDDDAEGSTPESSGKGGVENVDLPSTLRFPKWELPAFLCLFFGIPNRSVPFWNVEFFQRY